MIRNRLVSFENMIGSNKSDELFSSFTYNEHSSGHSIKPCGTPHIIVPSSVFSSLLI